MRKHTEFILTPISRILRDAAITTSGIDAGMESYPLCDYIMQSLFLKMTGFQEQKVKCISWELATDNYELRYKRYNRDPLGECSSYNDKKTVLLDLVSLLEQGSVGRSRLIDEERDAIKAETRDELEIFYNQPLIKGWSQKLYYDFTRMFSKCGKNCVLFNKESGGIKDLLGHCENCGTKNTAPSMCICHYGTLKDVYESLFKHRNRCAHNTASYQQNLPSLETMDDETYVLDNYYLHFAVLMVIDKIFIKLFQKYLEKYDNGLIL